MNIKRLIAREGLIIIAFVLFVILWFYATAFLRDKANKTFENFKTEHNITITYDFDTNEYKGFINGLESTPLNKWSKEQLLILHTGFHLQKKADYMASLNSDGVPLMLFGYPLLLLIRFIFWAIGTLKKKE